MYVGFGVGEFGVELTFFIVIVTVDAKFLRIIGVLKFPKVIKNELYIYDVYL